MFQCYKYLVGIGIIKIKARSAASASQVSSGPCNKSMQITWHKTYATTISIYQKAIHQRQSKAIKTSMCN